MTKYVESVEARYKRYQTAKSDLDEMRALLNDAYFYSAPYRNDFFVQTQGTDEMVDVFDNTAVDGVVKYASTIQSIIMPASRRFVNLIPGNELKKVFKEDDDSLNEIKEKLQEATETLFTNLNNSNFYRVVNEALQDMCISTGVIMINEGTPDQPFIFSSVPLSKVYFGCNASKEIVDFYRDWNIKGRLIKEQWQNAVLPESLESKIKNSPDEEVALIESFIEYPFNSPEYRYYYCVMTEKKEEIFNQFMSYQKFIAFRSNVSSHSNYGIGEIIRLLPTIRFLNRLLEDGVAIVDWKAFPAWMLTSSAIINPYSISVGSNQVFYVRNEPGDAIKLLQPNNNGSDQVFVEWVQSSRQTIKDTLFLSPFNEPVQSAVQSATEVQIRYENWIRSSGAQAGRLSDELVKPIIKVCVQILKKLGVLKDLETSLGFIEMKINNTEIAIDYASPLLAIQSQEDITNLNAYMQNWAGLYGVEFLYMMMNIELIPQWMAEKQNVPLSFIKSTPIIKNGIAQLLGMAKASLNNAQAPGGGGQQAAPQQLLVPGQSGGQSQQQGSPALLT